MFKKNSWIVALLIALAFSAFLIGCIDPLEVREDTDTYTEFELTGFNAFGGNKENQQGWATDGVIKVGSDGTGSFTGDIGLTVEKLQNARYLVVEMNDGFPKNNFETIWGCYDASGATIGGNDWNQFSSITSSSGTLNAGMGTQDGNIFKMEMSKILKSYPTFRDPKATSIFLLIQHWGNGGTAACIKSAKLMIPDKVEPPPPPEPPTPPLFTGKGTYVVPGGTYSTSFYVDLNEAKEVPTGVNGGSAGGTAKIEKDKITVGFTASGQGFYVPFTDDQAAYLQMAGDNKYTIEVTIEGEYTANQNFRWTLSNGTSNSWATYALFNQDQTTFGDPNTMGIYSGSPATLQPGVTNQGSTIKGFIFQAQQNDDHPFPATGGTTLTVESIFIEVSGAGSGPEELDELEFTFDWGYPDIEKPWAGATAPTAVDGKNFGTAASPVYHYDGKLEWSPDLVDARGVNKFAPMTQYTATIVVTPRLGYYFGATPLTSVTVNGEDAVFTFASRTVTYTFPERTSGDTDPLARPEYDGDKLVVNITKPDGSMTTMDVTDVSARNGDTAFMRGDNGFLFRSIGVGGGYQEEYPMFKIALGINYPKNSRIRFKYKGIEGDLGWKDIGIAICTAAPTNADINIGTVGNDVKNKTGTPPVEGASIGKVVWKENYANNGLKEQIFTATLPGGLDNTTGDIWVVITMHGEKRKAFEVYDITFLPPPPTFVNVKVGAATQQVVPVGVAATVEMLDGSIGFIHRRPDNDANDYQKSYIYFPVDLGEGKTITDYSKVIATIEGDSSGSDYKYKKMAIFVKGEAFTGEITEAMRGYLSTGYGGTYGYREGKITNEWNIVASPVSEGAYYADGTATGNEVFICVYVHAPKGQTYTITDIELVPNP
jgi:hypothetical protein